MPAPSSRSINLMPPSEFESSFWGRFLKWGVSTGRYILIVTEMLVIIAFLSEFKLYDDLSNLNSTLEGQKNILESMSPMEKEFRQVQARLEAANTLLQSQLEAQANLDKLVEKVPVEIKMNSVRVEKNGVTMEATTISEQALGGMLRQLAADQQWKNVKLNDFVTDNGAIMKFSLVLDK